MDDCQHSTDCKGEFVAESHVNQDAEQREQAGDNSSPLNFSSNGGADFVQSRAREFCGREICHKGMLHFFSRTEGRSNPEQFGAAGDVLLILNHRVVHARLGNRATQLLGFDFLGKTHGEAVSTQEINSQCLLAATKQSVGTADDDHDPCCDKGWFRQTHEIDFGVFDEMQHVQRLDHVALEQPVEDQASYHQSGEEGCGHTDGQGDTESFDRACAHIDQNDGRNQSCDVGVKDRSEGPVIPRFDCTLERFALGGFFADTLKNQHVRINSHTDREHDTRDARDGESGVDRAHHSKKDDNVQQKCHVGHRSREHVITDHEPGHSNRADDRGFDAGGNGVLTQERIHTAFFFDFDGSFQRIFEDIGQLESFL